MGFVSFGLCYDFFIMDFISCGVCHDFYSMALLLGVCVMISIQWGLSLLYMLRFLYYGFISSASVPLGGADKGVGGISSKVVLQIVRAGKKVLIPGNVL